MNKLTTKIISIGLSATLFTGGIGMSVYALNRNKDEKTEPEKTTAEAVDESKAISKDETVYVLAGADGSVDKIIVSDWIKNVLGNTAVSDKSELADIENVKGDEAYTMNGDNMKVWDAQGNDIYYQGNIEKELPVGLTVSYKLDGKKVSASEIAGKSGKVTIRFDYDNRQYETVEIDGKKEKIYVPFALLTGMLLDTDTFTNVEVSNGKLINDGNHIAVVGIAFPGLQENLAIGKDKFEIPSYVEINADATNFEFGTTVTIATNEIFNKIDTGKFDSLDEVTASVDKISEATSQLMDGSSELYGGLCTLLDKSEQLVDGINKLAEGAKVLKDGASDLDDGAARVKSGMAELSAGLNELSSNNDTLNGGAEQVFDTFLSTADTQIAAAGLSVPKLTIENYTDVLNGVIASLDETAVYNKALSTVTSEVEANRPLIAEKVTAAVRTQVTEKVTAAVKEQVAEQVKATVREQVAGQVIPVATGNKMTKDSYDAAIAAGLIDAQTKASIENAIDTQMVTSNVQSTIEANINAQMASETILATVSVKTDEQMQSEEIKNTIVENTETQAKQAISENMASDAVQSQLKKAADGLKSITSLKESLDSYNSFYLGLKKYTNGVASASNGASQLKDGTSDLKFGTEKLKAGTSELYDGIFKIRDGAPALIDGVTKLKDGSMQLSDGLKQFNQEGVQKIVGFAKDNLSGLITRMKATVDVSKNYKNFSGISDDMDGQVKFIYRTDSITADK